MKRIIGLAALLATIVVATLAPLANAQCVTGTGTNVLFKWDANGFSYEGPGAYTNYVSPAGNVLNNLAAATLLCGPLAGLDPNDPTKEYTIVWTGLTSQGTVTTPFGSSGSKYTTVYLNGTWALYEGAVDARGYTAGTMPLPGIALPQYAETNILLSGPIDSLTTVITKSSLGSVNGSFRGRYRITGGSYKNLVCGGSTVPALFDGLWYPVAPPAGYTGHNNGKFDAPDCSTPSNNSTWGRIKVLYR